MTTRKLAAIALVLAACSQGAATTTATSADTSPPTTPASSTATTSTSTPDAPATTATPSTTTGSTTRPPATLVPPELADGETICDRYGSAETIGEVADPALFEISGIAASRTHDGVTWAVNDSGDGPTVYAIVEGETVATVTLSGAFPIDWEDLDLGPGPDGSDHLFIGDVGDNLGFRPWLSIFHLPEPDPTEASDLAARAVELELVYPDLEGADTEAMAIDPITGDIIVIPKSRSAVGVYRAAAPHLGERTTMERIATLDLRAEITAAAFSPSGDRLVLRGYKTIWAWPRGVVDVGEVIASEPCEIEPAKERQGESITVRPDNGLVTISEGGNPAIHLVPVDE